VNNPFRRTPLAAAALATFCVPVIAFAQGDPTVPPTPTETRTQPTRLPEVKVKEQQETVNEYKSEKPSSPKYTEALLDTPQTVQIITRKAIEDQNQLSLRQMLSNVPGITFGAAEGGNGFGDNITFRGSRIENDIQLDGIRDSAQTARTDPFNLEQLEVTKGASSVYSGSGAVTGTINQISKTAKADDFTRTTFGVGTDAYYRVTADANRKLSDTSAARLNLMLHENDSPDRDQVWAERWGVAPTVTFGLGTDLRTTLSYLHQENERVPDRGVLWRRATNPGDGDPVPTVDRDTYFGLGNVDREDATVDVFTAILEKDLNSAVKVRNITRKGTTKNESTIATLNGLVCIDGVAFESAAVCPTAPEASGLTDTYWRVEGNSLIPGTLRDDKTEIVANVTDLTWDFATGGLQHTVVLGLSLSRERFDRTTRQARRPDGTAFDTTITYDPVTGLPSGDDDGLAADADAYVDLDNPDRTWDRGLNWVDTGRLRNELDNQAIYAFDSIQIGPRWRVSGGLRVERNEANYRNFPTEAAATDLDSNDTLISGRLGVTFKPTDIGSVYVAYGNSEAPSATTVISACSGAATNANCNLDPEETENYEVGTKWELFDRQLLLSGAVFRNDRVNARVNSGLPDDPVQVLDGRSRVDGIELAATGQITRNWSVMAGFALLDSEVRQSVGDDAPANVADAQKGQDVPNTPEKSGSVWTNYLTPFKVELGYGLQYIGEYETEAARSTTTVPDAFIQNALVGYQVRRGFDLRLNINNLADEKWWSSVRPQGWAHPGEGRSMVLTAHYEF
jgi:catecholate siderophore receptor